MTQHLLARTLLTLLILPTMALCDLAAGQGLGAGLSQAATVQGETIQLEAEGGSFAAIYHRNQRGESRGGIVLLHDQGSNANSNEVIRPLRLGLAESGWDTLSLQLPTAYRDEGPVAWRSRQALIGARAQAGLDWLKARQLPDRVVIALGDSGVIALRFASATAPGDLQALVLVSSVIRPDDIGATLADLGKLGLPALDIYAERDRPQVTATAPARKNAAREAGYHAYQQRTLTGAGAGFHRQEDSLIAAIRAWLASTTAAGMPTGRE